MSTKPLTQLQRAKLISTFIAMISVGLVYGSGKQCNTEGKEAMAGKEYKRQAKQFLQKTGTFSDFTESTAGIVEKDLTGMKKGEKIWTGFTDKQIWEKGMAGRREVVGPTEKYAGILKYKIQKPAVAEGEPAPASADCVVEVVIDSGGGQTEGI